MQIQSINSINSSPNMKAGTYFINRPCVSPKKQNIQLLAGEVEKISSDGIRYVEDTSVPQEIRDSIANIPFIHDLSQAVDTFIYFLKTPKKHVNNAGFNYKSFAQISWINNAKGTVERRAVSGSSPISQELANTKMLDNLQKENFTEII